MNKPTKTSQPLEESRLQPLLLLFATFVLAVSGLVYELLAGTLSSYLLGDSVYQFSIVIGLFMTAMGIGAWLSRFIQENLEQAFVVTQVMLGMIGGLSAPILFYAFAYVDNYEAFLFLICITTGTLIGLEIPIITRILEKHHVLKLNISNVLTFDYIGALVAAIIFPLVIVPQLGLMSASLMFGLMNIMVAMLVLYLFRDRLNMMPLALAGVACAGLLTFMLWQSQQLMSMFEQRLYQEEVIFTEQTPYQRLTLTRDGKRMRLFLNGNLQFDSQDEYRYHETLVHPVMGLVKHPEHVLILGGGDGMAVREILKHDKVGTITLVDLDSAVTTLFRDNPMLSALNSQALQNDKVKIVNKDAWQFIMDDETLYNVVIIDLPDPHNPSLSKLYSRAFYQHLGRKLARDGLIVTQATSPLFAREAFWCIQHTLDETPSVYHPDETLYTLPYHTYIPSFGDWGFVIAGHYQPAWNAISLPESLQFLTPEILASLTHFPPDMASIETDVNTLQAHPLIRYYEAGWARWFP
ncbi:MAG: polyamine aminopropyltransferase [Pseudomonadota bacterium]